MTFQLNSDFLTYCKGDWNGTDFVNGNEVDCCMNSCKNHINFCFSECLKSDSYSKYKSCTDKCFQFVKNCEMGCHKDDNFDLNNNLRELSKSLLKTEQEFDKSKFKKKKNYIVFILILLFFLVFFIKKFI